MPSKSPDESTKSYHHGDLRRAVLDAVHEIILEKGPDALSLRECARRAGVSPGAPAYHFGDKQGVLDEFALEGVENLQGVVRAELERADPDPVSQLCAVGRAYVRAALEYPAHFRVMARRGTSSLLGEAPESPTRHAARTHRPVLELLQTVITAVDEAEGRTSTALEERALFAWSTVHGYALLCLDNSAHPGVAVAGVEEALDRAEPLLARVLSGLREERSDRARPG
ncbi:MAG: TetR/AcrR family transcriptional regulator [Planctomycetota bacterium]